MEAENSFYVKSIATYAPTFFGYIISVIAIVKIIEMKYAYLCSFFRLNRLSPNIATMMVRVPDVMRNTGTTKNSCKKNMNEIVMSCHTMVPICMGESKNAKPKQTVLMLG